MNNNTPFLYVIAQQLQLTIHFLNVQTAIVMFGSQSLDEHCHVWTSIVMFGRQQLDEHFHVWTSIVMNNNRSFYLCHCTSVAVCDVFSEFLYNFLQKSFFSGSSGCSRLNQLYNTKQLSSPFQGTVWTLGSVLKCLHDIITQFSSRITGLSVQKM